MKAPGAGVDVEQFVLAVARVAFVFDFDEAVVVEGFDEALGVVVDFRGVDGFDVGGGTTEFAGMLTHAAGGEGAVGAAVAGESAPGILLEPVAGDDFLNENFFSADLFRGLCVERVELLGRIGAPRFGAGSVKEVLLNCGFDSER